MQQKKKKKRKNNNNNEQRKMNNKKYKLYKMYCFFHPPQKSLIITYTILTQVIITSYGRK